MTSLQSHTPGPWHVSKFGGRADHIVSNFGRICEILTIDHESVTPAVEEANARLIAAAPELLEALEVLLLNREIGEYESQKQGLPRMIEVNAMARAAIAKAKGAA